MSHIVLDIECSKIPAFKPWHKDSFLSSICIEDSEGTSKVWFFNPEVGDSTQSLAEITKLIEDADVIVGHNIKFDALWLIHLGIDLTKKVLYCTQIAEYFILGHASSREDGLDLNLNAVSARYGQGSKIDEMAEYWAAGINTDQIPLDLHEEYVKQDVHLTHEVFKQQVEILQKAGLIPVVQLSFDVTKVIAYMEYSGVLLDTKFVKELKDTFDVKIKEIDNILISITNVSFSPDSTKQLAAILYGGCWEEDGRETYTKVLKGNRTKEQSRNCKIPVEYPGLGFEVPDGMTSDKTGLGKTGKEALNMLATDTPEKETFISCLLERKVLSKALSTLYGKSKDAGFMSKIDEHDRLHPEFNQTVTRTGRLSSTNPNGQNLPRKGTSPIKKCILPTYDYVVNVDFGQIEWRMAAVLSQDPIMVEETNAGLDVHALNARAFFGADKYEEDSKEFKDLRQAAKTMTFRLLYGGGGYAFFMDQRMPRFPLKRWEEIVAAFYDKYQGLKKWQDDNYRIVTKQGYLRTPSGRVLTYDRVRGRDGSFAFDRKQICNYSVQSISADLMFLAMKYTFEYLLANNLSTKILLTVHDSLVLDVPEKELEKICKDVLTIFSKMPIYAKEHFGWDINVPIVGDCEVGKNYGEISKINIS